MAPFDHASLHLLVHEVAAIVLVATGLPLIFQASRPPPPDRSPPSFAGRGRDASTPIAMFGAFAIGFAGILALIVLGPDAPAHPH